MTDITRFLSFYPYWILVPRRRWSDLGGSYRWCRRTCGFTRGICVFRPVDDEEEEEKEKQVPSEENGGS